MNIKKLNEGFKKLLEDCRFADIDAEGLYNSIVPESFGSITFEEMDKVKDFLGITGNESTEELQAIRNSIVKYYADNSEKLYKQAEEEWKDIKSKNPEASISDFRKQSKFDVMQDQMSAFTHVIDYLMHNKNKNESLENMEILGSIVELPDGFNLMKDNELMLVKNYHSLKQMLLDLADNM